MREIEFTTQFKKDYKRVGKSPTNKDLDFKLQAVVDLLCADLSLPFKLRDHKLKGQLGGVRECHLEPALIIKISIYPLFLINLEVKAIKHHFVMGFLRNTD